MERKIKCPTCKKTTQYTEKNPHRPFCQERCKLIDFGNWANESYTVPSPPSDQIDT